LFVDGLRIGMKNSDKGGGIRIGVFIRRELHENLRRLVYETGSSYRDIIEKALDSYIVPQRESSSKETKE
jgi:hypothetical protein